MNKYKKELRPIDLKNGYVDVYSVLELFEVDNHAVGHAIKKLLMAGKRGAKDYSQDLEEAIESIERVTSDIYSNENSRLRSLINEKPEGATHYSKKNNKWIKEEKELCWFEYSEGVWIDAEFAIFTSTLTKVEDL